jgi:tetratricopeptide (TPR) repeat protein
MTDLKRHDASSADATGTGQDSRVEDLLVKGLDRYFLGHYEDAIHLWTRVLFLDRSHTSARAYIDRARGAIVERQRRAEESLQNVTELLDQGRSAEARTQLQQATDILGEDERTAALRLRLERLERAYGGAPRIRAVPAPPVVRWGSWVSDRLTMRTWLAAAVLVVATVVLTSSGVRARLGVGPESIVAAPTLSPGPVPVIGRAEVALVRARALYARGRLAEALDVLDRVEFEQITREESDRLRVDIQRLLLATASRSPLTPEGSGVARSPRDERQGPR